MRVLAFAFVLATIAGAQAAAASRSATATGASAYDVYVVETRGRPLDRPTVAALYVGRVAVPAAGGESEPLRARSSDGLLRAVVRARFGPEGPALIHFVNDDDEDEDERASVRLDRPVVVAPDAAFRRGRGRERRRRVASLVALAAAPDAPVPAAEIPAADVYRLLCRTLAEKPVRGPGLGRVLGRAPLVELVPAEELAGYRSAWRRLRDENRRGRFADSPYFPALLAAADPETIAFLIAREPKDDLPTFEPDASDATDAAVDTDAGDGADAGGVVAVEVGGRDLERFRAPAMPLAVEWETPLALAYVQATDPDVRGAAGWLSYKYNPGAFFPPMAEDVVAGRVRLPGNEAERARREKLFRDGLRTRDVGPALVAVAGGLAAMGVLLFVLRLALSRLLFR